MKIILGLGNIGPDYVKTRHNIGFEVVDFLAEKYGGEWKENKKFRSFISEIRINNEKVILMKPTTFYNLAGLALKIVLDYYKINHQQDLLVIQDDLAEDFGIIRVRDMGSAGGNNGIRSIIGQYNTNFWRIKIGTMNGQFSNIPAANFVLSKFNREEQKVVGKIKAKAAELIEDFVSQKLENTTIKFE